MPPAFLLPNSMAAAPRPATNGRAAWAETARRLGTFPYTVWRWWKGGVRPNAQHMLALREMADALSLGHLFTN